MPKAAGAVIHWSNNVIYNWSGNAAYSGSGEPTRTNLIGNYYIAGPNTRPGDRTFFSPDAETRIYYADNYRDMNKNGVLDGTDPGAKVFIDGTVTLVKKPFPHVETPELDPPGTSVQTVLQRVGAFWWARDAVDARMIHDVQHQSGHFVADPADVGGWDKTGSARAEDFDPDRDGMASAWEVAHGLDPQTADGGGDVNNDGYTNLENYLNDLGAFPLLNEALWQGGNGRYVETARWRRSWQPSRFDTVVIESGVATVDAPGAWAGAVRLAPSRGRTAGVSIESGFWRVPGDVELSGDGRAGVLQTGGVVRIDGTLRLGSRRGVAVYALVDGVLYAHTVDLSAGGALRVRGGTLHAGEIAAEQVQLAGGCLAPGSEASAEAVAACLGNRALVPPVETSIGTTRVQGDLDLSDATLEIGVESSDRVDSLTVDGHLQLGGTLEVQLLDGYKPPAGTTFTVAKAASVLGQVRPCARRLYRDRFKDGRSRRHLRVRRVACGARFAWRFAACDAAWPHRRGRCADRPPAQPRLQSAGDLGDLGDD